MMYLKSLMKILLPVMDLNMTYKIHKTSKIPAIVISEKRARNPPYVLFSPLHTLYYIAFDQNNLKLASPALSNAAQP